jgi:hypothetical protein
MLTKPSAVVFGLVSVLIVGYASLGFTAELWSLQNDQTVQPPQNEQSSPPPGLDLWAQPPQPDPWTQAPETEQRAQSTSTEQSGQQPQSDQSTQASPTEGQAQQSQTEQWSTNYVIPPVSTPVTTGTTGATDVVLDPALDFPQLYGTWRIWTSGAVIAGQPIQGASQGRVEINKDGTYSMVHAVWAKDGLEGKWRLSFPGEINGLWMIAIVFLNDDGSSDWAVSNLGEGRATLMSALSMSGSSSFWIASDQLTRE